MLKSKSILLGIAVIIITTGLSFLFVSMKEAPKERESIAKKIIVPIQKIRNDRIDLKLSVVGNLEAQEKVDVYAEVTGILKTSAKSFLEGVHFNQGEVLLSIIDDKYKAEVYSKRSSFMNEIAAVLPDLKFDYPKSYIAWEKYLQEFDVEKELKPVPAAFSDKEKYFLAGKNIYTSYFNIKSLEKQLEKYSIKAPFTGEVIESNIKPGTLVMTGQKLGEYVNTSKYDLVVGVDLNSLNGIAEGNHVRLYSNNFNGSWDGVVRRISKKVDEKTQMVNIYISVSGADLKEGMFLKADISLNQNAYGIEIPRKLLVDHDNVYVVEDHVIILKPVEIIQKKENTVIVEGIDNGSLLSLKTAGIHKGMSVEPVVSE